MVSPLNHRLPRLKKQITQIIFLVSGFWFLVSPCYAQKTRCVRVAIIQDTPTLRLKINGYYEVINSLNNKVLYHGRHLNTTVTTYQGGILLGATKSMTNKVLIKANDSETIIINGRLFKGDIQLIKKENLRLLVVNHIDLEDYIKGILYHESSHYWPAEGLKAQAIVCRSYAVYQMQQNSSNDYDVTSDVYSQVYGGRTSERYRTNKIVDETKGQVLVYQGRVFPAYYHATCAGSTEDASILWNIDLPVLKGVVCNFCKDSPHFNWHRILTLDELADKLTESGDKIKDIKNIIILSRDKSGRVKDLSITSNKEELKISAKDFRNIIGPNLIRSTNFNVNIVDNDAVFEGVGWGHGVGLCQWGAYFMAKQGYKYYQILKYYYPGSDVETIRF